MVELQPLIQVMPPQFKLQIKAGRFGWCLRVRVWAFVLLWLMRRRLMLWWLRLMVRPASVQTHARKVLKLFPHLHAEQRRRLELIAYAPAAQPEHVTQLKALLREVRP